MRTAAGTAVVSAPALSQRVGELGQHVGEVAARDVAAPKQVAGLRAQDDDGATRSYLGRWIVFFSIAIAGCAVDLLTKSWIFGRLGMPSGTEKLSVIGDILILETSLNEGALFGFGQGGGWVFIVLAFVAIGGILTWLSYGRAIQERWVNVALGSIVGGITGNLYDRLGLPGLKWNYPAERVGEPVHAVRDWIHFEIASIGFDFAVFNIADSLLVVGVSFLLLQTFRAEARREQAANS